MKRKMLTGVSAVLGISVLTGCATLTEPRQSINPFVAYPMDEKAFMEMRNRQRANLETGPYRQSTYRVYVDGKPHTVTIR